MATRRSTRGVIANSRAPNAVGIFVSRRGAAFWVRGLGDVVDQRDKKHFLGTYVSLEMSEFRGETPFLTKNSRVPMFSTIFQIRGGKRHYIRKNIFLGTHVFKGGFRKKRHFWREKKILLSPRPGGHPGGAHCLAQPQQQSEEEKFILLNRN